VVNAYELPVLLRTLRDETKIPEPSVIITSQPCVLIKDYHALKPYTGDRRQVHRLRQLHRCRLPGDPRHAPRPGQEGQRHAKSISLSCASRAPPVPAAACA
jgi:hypothetical protein